MNVKKKATKKVVTKSSAKSGTKVAAKSSAKSGTKVAAKSSAKSGRKAGARSAGRSGEVDPTSDVVLRTLPPAYGAGPDMPVKVAQLEFASLARLAETVAAPLAKVGITRLQITTLQRFAQQLAAREAGWQKARAGVTLAATDRKRLFEAEALDAKLLAGGRWACRKDDEAQTALGRIADGSGLNDTICDLRELVAFWAAHPSELACTDITTRDLARATELAGQLGRAAEKETSNLDAATALELRNRCFWAADELAKEIREGGRYAYRLQPKTAAKFASRYRTSVARRARHKTKDEQPETPPATV